MPITSTLFRLPVLPIEVSDGRESCRVSLRPVGGANCSHLEAVFSPPGRSPETYILGHLTPEPGVFDLNVTAPRLVVWIQRLRAEGAMIPAEICSASAQEA